MAVDTETKRRSALGMTLMFLTVAPVPDGTVGAVDREHIIGIYAGIAPAVSGVQTNDLHIFSTVVVEPNHVSDSGDNVLFKGQIEAQGGAYVGGGTNYATISSAGEVSFGGSGGLRLPRFVDDVSNPPTDAELDTAIGAPSAAGEGYAAIVDDNDAGANVYLVVSTGTDADKWWILTLTQAV